MKGGATDVSGTPPKGPMKSPAGHFIASRASLYIAHEQFTAQ